MATTNSQLATPGFPSFHEHGESWAAAFDDIANLDFDLLRGRVDVVVPAQQLPYSALHSFDAVDAAFCELNLPAF